MILRTAATVANEPPTEMQSEVIANQFRQRLTG
jgi:hypothetical protein